MKLNRPSNKSVNTKQYLLIPVLISLIQLASAQAFDTRFGNFNREQIEFDQEFILRNGIKEIRVDYSKKIPGRPIEALPDQDVMRYDSRGRILSKTSIRSTRLGIDTLWNEWVYSGELLFAELKKDALGVYRQEIIRNAEGELAGYKRYRNDVLVNEEQYRYAVIGDTLVQQTFINADGLAYKTLTTRKFSDGRLAEQREQFSFTGRVCRLLHDYNEQGWVSECIREDEQGKERTVYEYSALGEIMKVSYYNGNEMSYGLEILYENGLPDAWIRQELSTNHLRIGKFTYQRSPFER